MSCKTTTLFMIRHGRLNHTESNVFTGQSDIPLSEKGRKETLSYLTLMKKNNISLLVSSDLSRTTEPAMEYSKHLKCLHIVKKELREINAGDWESKTFQEVMLTSNDYLQKRYANPVKVPFPNGESLQDLKKRVVNTISTLLKNNLGQNILLIGHAGVIRIIILSYLKLPLSKFFCLEVDYGSLSAIRFFEDGNVTLKLFNFKDPANV